VSPPGRAPRLTVEAALHAQGHRLVGGMDEVGRGCLSGPVTVGVVVVDAGIGRPPRGLRDSKLLTPQARRALVPGIGRWVRASAVAHASSAEIDAIGIIAALRLAGHRALARLPDMPDCVLLDGNHNYLAVPAQMELDLGEQPAVPCGPADPADPAAAVYRATPPGLLDECPPVRTQIKADMRCASVAAASVLAKTTRDGIMIDLAAEHPRYGWEINKGYATPYHRAALRELGPSPYHRVSWHLGLDELGDFRLDEEADRDLDEPVDDGLEPMLHVRAMDPGGHCDLIELGSGAPSEGQNGVVNLSGRSRGVRA
jgi:ribonuclease HII